jgi:cation-transporting ATPase 13A1
MKESLTAGVGSERDGKGDENTTAPSPSASMAMHLDMMGAHRVSVLFSGTTLLTVDAEAGAGSAMPHVAPAPDRGAVAFVVRTGFSSSQGALMQMIEFSQQTVTGNAREIGLALLVLLMFALAAAGYVLREGLRKKEKTTHELLLKCVIIITSVVPRQFPMQTAVAVNMALMALVVANAV